MKVSVVGAGYVGLSLAVLLSSGCEVVAVDVVEEKVDMINRKESPISDREIEEYLAFRSLNLRATTKLNECAGSDYIIISTPTNYDPEAQYFDTSSVEEVLGQLKEIASDATIVIKSTVPIGFTEKLYSKMKLNILFSPEFLREGRALYDNLHPSRIIVGVPSNDSVLEEKAKEFIHLLKECSEESEVKTMVTGSTEAESVKLFSNTYLAMRVAFFNELDSFADKFGLSSKSIIDGVCMDQRIGNYYNNPSFGYGGYCLPKDTKQLLANYKDVPNDLISAIVKSNDTRKKFVAEQVSTRVPIGSTIGVYRLTMKMNSDNFRESSIISIIKLLENEYNILIYEPTLNTTAFNGWSVVDSIDVLIEKSDLILANRVDEKLQNAKNVFCRDIFGRD